MNKMTTSKLTTPFLLLGLLVLTLMGCEPNPPQATPPPPYALGDSVTGPVVFAAGTVSTGRECNVAFSPDGHNVYFNRMDSTRHAHLYQSRFENGSWQPAEQVAFSDTSYSDFDPFITPDGQRLFFASTRPTEGGEEDIFNHDIWYVERTATGWGTPQHTGPAINSSGQEGYPSITADGTLYFFSARDGERGEHDLFRAHEVGGVYDDLEKLESISTDLPDVSPYVAPDESYLIFYRTDENGNADFYVSYNVDGNWQAAEPLNNLVNTEDGEYCASVSPDGAYLFFSRYVERRGRIYQIPLAESGVRTK